MSIDWALNKKDLQCPGSFKRPLAFSEQGAGRRMQGACDVCGRLMPLTQRSWVVFRHKKADKLIPLSRHSYQTQSRLTEAKRDIVSILESPDV